MAAQIALWVALVPVVGASLYLGALALLAILPAPAPKAGLGARRFAIIIPAHDEEASIRALLASVGALDYPPYLVQTLVVADNCGDATAAVARECGATVVERVDASRRGKGFALAYGLAHLGDAWDAVVFIDADCTVTPNLLAAFDARLTAGDDVIQAYYTMTPAASSTRVVRQLALELVHRVRPRAKRWLRASAGLKGSGMCFSREAMSALGWTATGLAEDIEQHVELLRQGLRVSFAGEATVTGAAPATLDQASTQHRRWEAGRLKALRRHAAGLATSGLRTRSIARLDAAAELLVPPLSLLGIAAPALLAIAVALDARPLTLAAGASIVSLGFYVLVGVAFLRPNAIEFARCVVTLPVFALWKAAVYARVIVRPATSWERTTRS